MIRETDILDVALDVAWSFHGLHYKWGGDDPMDGFDCSGFVIEVLKSVGKLPRRGDWTSRGLFKLFDGPEYSRDPSGSFEPGCLVFWSSNPMAGTIYHVEFCISGILSMGAAGGRSNTNSIGMAIDQNAYIKVRPVRGRFTKEYIHVIDPFAECR